MFKYTKEEEKRNKIIKHNIDKSIEILEDPEAKVTREKSDLATKESEELLRSLGLENEIEKAKKQAEETAKTIKLENSPKIPTWEELYKQAEQEIPYDVYLEEILTQEEINNASVKLDEINKLFSHKTSIVNKTDLAFLAIATSLQVTKALLFPYIAEKFDYGNSFDSKDRLNHDDKSIKDAQKEANNKFKKENPTNNNDDKTLWMKMISQGVPYDLTSGSKALGLGLGSKHRLYTLGHDPILGWIFGTANILTDSITLNNFNTYRVQQKPKLITPETISILDLFSESSDVIQAHNLNLPAALFVQSQHLKSDKFTKLGLPVPIITTINEDFASKLYSQNYDSLCFARDAKIAGASFVVSAIIDLIIGIVHGFYRDKNEPQELFEVRTRKILLISNSIATSSSIVATCITQNPKTLDIGSLLSTVSHLFRDIRFITKIKNEFIQKEIDASLKIELAKIDNLYSSL